jgi:FkbM family methyltransferase
MSYISTLYRDMAIRTMRSFPNMRGFGVLSNKINSLLLKSGCSPLVLAQMKLDYEMLIDMRSFTESYALYSGEYDTQKIRFLMALMQRDSVFVDVGANVGFYTVPLAKKASTVGGKVYAFEPHPSNFSRLEHNINVNKMEKYVNSINVGLSVSSGKAELTLREDFAHGSDTGNAAIYINDDDQAYPTVKIPLRSLDSMYGNDIHRIDIIKLDIEGHEDMFMKGAVNAVGQERPIIMMEVNKYYYSRRHINLYYDIIDKLSPSYGVYIPKSSKKIKISRNDHFNSLSRVNDFESCAEVDNAFLIPDEKLENAFQALRSLG